MHKVSGDCRVGTWRLRIGRLGKKAREMALVAFGKAFGQATLGPGHHTQGALRIPQPFSSLLLHLSGQCGSGEDGRHSFSNTARQYLPSLQLPSHLTLSACPRSAVVTIANNQSLLSVDNTIQPLKSSNPSSQTDQSSQRTLKSPGPTLHLFPIYITCHSSFHQSRYRTRLELSY